MVLVAESGLYDQTMKLLDLSGGVSLYHDSGYELHTDTARVDLARNTARGLDPVTGHGPQGRIEAEGFEIAEHAKSIVFTGRAQLGLRAAPGPGRHPTGGKAAARPDPNAPVPGTLPGAAPR